jgi:hypothetical protein
MTEAVQKDLELVTTRCEGLEEEIEAKKSEIADIKALQVIVAQSHSMEETMQSKVQACGFHLSGLNMIPHSFLMTGE